MTSLMQEFKLAKGCSRCIHELRNGCYSPEARKMTLAERNEFLASREPCNFHDPKKEGFNE